MPEGFVVVGSLIGLKGISGEHEIEVVLDAPINMDEAVDAYREVLESLGWEESNLPNRSIGGGFAYGAARRRALFCKSARGPSLAVTAQQVPEHIAQDLGTPTDVRLEFSGESRRSPCSQSRYRPMTELEPVVPTLIHPVGARPLEYGMGHRAGPDDAVASAAVRTQLDITSSLVHYEAQFERAGWEQRSKEIGESQAFSGWTTVDQEGRQWMCVLSVLRMPKDEQEYFVQTIASVTDD